MKFLQYSLVSLIVLLASCHGNSAQQEEPSSDQPVIVGYVTS